METVTLPITTKIDLQRVINDSQLNKFQKLKILINNGIKNKKDLVNLTGIDNSALANLLFKEEKTLVGIERLKPIKIDVDSRYHFFEILLSFILNGTISNILFSNDSNINGLKEFIKKYGDKFIDIGSIRFPLDLYDKVYQNKDKNIILGYKPDYLLNNSDYSYLLYNFLTKRQVGYGVGLEDRDIPKFYLYEKSLILIEEPSKVDFTFPVLNRFTFDLTEEEVKDRKVQIFNKKITDLSVKQLDIFYLNLVREDKNNKLLGPIDNLIKTKYNNGKEN